MSSCVSFSYIFYSEITSNQMFFFNLEQYVVMSNRFILPIAIDSIRAGGRRITAAQTLSLQRPSRHYGREDLGQAGHESARRFDIKE